MYKLFKIQGDISKIQVYSTILACLHCKVKYLSFLFRVLFDNNEWERDQNKLGFPH